MGKRFRPPPTAPPKERMNCTLTEHLANIKEQQETKGSNSKMAEWEKLNSRGDDDLEGPILSIAQKAVHAGPMPEKGKKKKDKKKDKDKSKRKKKEKDKSKKEKKKDKKKKKDKSKKKKGSSSSGSSSDSSDSEEDAAAKKAKFEEAAKSSKQGWKISDFLKGGGDSDSS
mmetsp:Transcript_36642/g.94866  ORF Transcript_36642/g.94866 Transcript_36642/m.94866 type:complete len:170 (+) Transcript_36642:154-663(+)